MFYMDTNNYTMLQKISIPFLFILALFTFQSTNAQNSKDSLQAVNFFGTIYAVKSSTALQLSELKPLVKNNPNAFKSFKKARRIKALSIGLEIISIVPATLAIISENDTEFWIGIGVSGILNGVGTYLMLDPYNKHLTNCIKEYNKGNSYR